MARRDQAKTAPAADRASTTPGTEAAGPSNPLAAVNNVDVRWQYFDGDGQVPVPRLVVE